MRKPGSGEREQREAELSRARQQQAREQVIRPLERLAAHNQFADMIRASLTDGRRKGT